LRDLPSKRKKGQPRPRGRPRKYGKNRISLAKRAGHRRGWQTIECVLYNEYHLNLWMHTLVELWAWDRSHTTLCDRRDSPWDDAGRRPSHANRRKALRQTILRDQLSTITRVWRLPRKITQLAKSLMILAS
jgi:hypothetical protein